MHAHAADRRHERVEARGVGLGVGERGARVAERAVAAAEVLVDLKAGAERGTATRDLAAK